MLFISPFKTLDPAILPAFDTLKIFCISADPKTVSFTSGSNKPDKDFSKTRYSNIRFINNGGWHFTNIKSPEEIRFKLKSYLHHREFEINPLSINEIEDLIKNKKAIYDLTIDKKNQKIGDGNLLEKYDLHKLPSYISNNLNKFKKWID